MGILKKYLYTLTIFVSIDFFWLYFASPLLYSGNIQFIFKETPSFFPAILFYLTFSLGLVYLVILPTYSTKTSDLYRKLVTPALFGLCTYGAYSFTNAAVIKHFSLTIALIEVVWGMIICTLTTIAVTTLIKNK